MTNHTHPASNAAIADLLYPHVTKTPDDFEQQYPPRHLPEGAFVTRFAPSPTGFVHIGGIYASLISRTLAEQSGGVFFLRIEDTDQKREIKGGSAKIIETLHAFGVPPMEGAVAVNNEEGVYGPYTQSHRTEIYHAYAKWLVAHDLAYPCFCTEEELAAIAAEQEKRQIKKGYYGEWAKSRHLSVAEITANLAAKKPWVLRVKAQAESKPLHVKDLVRGELELESNSLDMVLIKSNGIPTYHFAHVVDDHLMRTTHVTRGEEWLSSLPLHLQLFQMFGFRAPKFMHFSHIGKKEGDSVRKLSKRHDPEAAMSYYTEQGYPPAAILEYLMSLANPNFLDWRRNNPRLPLIDFKFDPKKLGKSIAIFDQPKLDFISRDIIARLPATEVYAHLMTWAAQFDTAFHSLLTTHKEYATRILNIEREKQQPRKDFATWHDFKDKIAYFFEELLPDGQLHFTFPAELTPDDAKAFLTLVQQQYRPELTKDEWLALMRDLAEQVGFAPDLKIYKTDPTKYKGQFGQIIGALRVALTGHTNTPDLYEIMQVMGIERVMRRLSLVIA